MKHLKKGLGWLKKKGIHAMLDHHALPGVASANQMFAGRCTSDVQFYVSFIINLECTLLIFLETDREEL